MTNEHAQIITGALLHDIGKVIYRTGNMKDHSTSGYEYLKNTIKLDEKQYAPILDSVRYHHGKFIQKANISNDSPAYITYIADNIASAADRRKLEDSKSGFEKNTPLESVFNILNGNDQHYYYKPGMLGEKGFINYPTQHKIEYTSDRYESILRLITNSIKGGTDLEKEPEKYINSLMEIME